MACIFYNMPCFYFTVETEMFPDLFATSFTLFKLWFVWSKMRFGLYALPFTLISKWQCSVVALPVLPVRAIACPAFTQSPTFAKFLELCG